MGRFGDRFKIFAWGQVFIYQVQVVQYSIRPDDLSIIGPEQYDWVTLLTCQTYDPDSDTYLYRYAVRAVLV